MKTFKITVLPGDGIGIEVTAQAIKVLNAVGKVANCSFEFDYASIGGAALDEFGTPLPDSTIEMCKQSDSVILGAVGGYKWDTLTGDKRPEAGLLGIRKALGLYANLRPAIIWKPLAQSSPLVKAREHEGLDLLVVRELTGGIYFGDRGRKETPEYKSGYDTLDYKDYEVYRIAKKAFEAARTRGKKVTSVDKANVLESSRFWRECVLEVAKDYPDVELDHMYVDNTAMQLVINPERFDVIVTGNLFGDILSDEASVITGSIGMLPSASIGDSKCGLYEPVHGSAPDIAGQDIANPLASILSVAMMLKYSLDMGIEAKMIEDAVEKVLELGYRTTDIMEDKYKKVGCDKMGSLVADNL